MIAKGHTKYDIIQGIFKKSVFLFNATRISLERKVPLETPRKPSKHAINFLKWPRNCQ